MRMVRNQLAERKNDSRRQLQTCLAAAKDAEAVSKATVC
jgi:hypothetical protein